MKTALMPLLILFAVVATTTAAHADSPSAEDLYARGQIAYDRADWTTAITSWKASYQLSGEAGLLFNIAQAQRQSGDCPGALATYHQYLRDDGDTASEQHRLAEDFERELAAKCPVAVQPQPTTTPQPDPQPNLGRGLNSVDQLNDRNDQPGRSLKIAGLVTGGAGIAVLATGLVFGHRSQSIASEVTNACRTSCDWAAWKDKDAEGRRDATVGRVLDGVGMAGIVGGAVLYYVGARESSVTIAPRSPEGGGAVVSWSGTW